MTEQTIIEAAKESGLDIDDPVVASAIAAAKQVGVEQERDRVLAHLELGGNSSAMKLATSAIEAGEPMTPTHLDHYLQAARATAELALRLEDDDVVLSALENVKLPKSAYADPVAAAVFDQLSAMVGSDGDLAIEDLEVGE